MNTDDPPEKKLEPDEPVICFCLDRTEAEIRDAVARLGLGTFEEVAAAVLAGTGCTACRPDIETILGELQRLGEPELQEIVDGEQQGEASAEVHPSR